jgi:hypothetical protein
VHAVYDCIGVGTRFVATSPPSGPRITGNIRAVSVLSNESIIGRFTSTSSIGIDTGGSIREANFRGDNKPGTPTTWSSGTYCTPNKGDQVKGSRAIRLPGAAPS